MKISDKIKSLIMTNSNHMRALRTRLPVKPTESNFAMYLRNKY